MPSPTLTLGSFLVAAMVGLTGMGGGALLTPMLMLMFGIPPLAAVSSDLVVSAVTKPAAALVHLRRGTVDLRLAGWLSTGSVPGALLGGLLGWWLGPGRATELITAHATGAVLLIAALAVTARAVVVPSLRRRGSRTAVLPGAPAAREGGSTAGGVPVVRKFPTILIGIVAGVAVGVTSTGSGTLVIAAMAALYPALPAGRLVGTDLAQAVPMVLAAALAHVAAGDAQLAVTAPLLIGGIPGVIAGSLLASRAPSGLLRPVLAVVVLASGLSLLGLRPAVLGAILGAATAALLAVVAWGRPARRRPARASRLRQDDMAPQPRRAQPPAADHD